LVDCGLVWFDRTREQNVCALTGLTLGGLWTDMDRPFHFHCWKSRQPARHVFNQRWFDCSSRTSQLGTSSVNAGLIVQVKPASSAPSLKTTYMVWMINAYRFHAPDTDKLHLHSTRDRTENRWPMGGSRPQVSGLRMIRHRPISPTHWWL